VRVPIPMPAFVPAIASAYLPMSVLYLCRCVRACVCV